MTAKPIVIASRNTADNYPVQLWDDGSVTYGRLSTYVRGAGVAKTAEAVNLNIMAGWLVIGDVSLYDVSELSQLVRAARRVVRSGDSGKARERMRAAADAALAAE